MGLSRHLALCTEFGKRPGSGRIPSRGATSGPHLAVRLSYREHPGRSRTRPPLLSTAWELGRLLTPHSTVCWVMAG